MKTKLLLLLFLISIFLSVPIFASETHCLNHLALLATKNSAKKQSFYYPAEPLPHDNKDLKDFLIVFLPCAIILFFIELKIAYSFDYFSVNKINIIGCIGILNLALPYIVTYLYTDISSYKLELAIKNNEIEKVKYLLKKNVFLNGYTQSDSDNDYTWSLQPAIATASQYNRNEIAKLILNDDRCRPNVSQYKGYTAFYWAIINNNFEIAAMLINKGLELNGNIDEYLFIAINCSSNKYLKLLLKKSDLNVKNDAGIPALSYAAKHNRYQAVVLLLYNGADMYIKDSNGKSFFEGLVPDVANIVSEYIV